MGLLLSVPYGLLLSVSYGLLLSVPVLSGFTVISASASLSVPCIKVNGMVSVVFKQKFNFFPQNCFNIYHNINYTIFFYFTPI